MVKLYTTTSFGNRTGHVSVRVYLSTQHYITVARYRYVVNGEWTKATVNWPCAPLNSRMQHPSPAFAAEFARALQVAVRIAGEMDALDLYDPNLTYEARVLEGEQL